MEMIFHSHTNKNSFEGCALGLTLKVRVFGTRKWPIYPGYYSRSKRNLGEWLRTIRGRNMVYVLGSQIEHINAGEGNKFY